MKEAVEEILLADHAKKNGDDPVNHPKHYCFGTIETIDYIESVLGEEGCYDYCIGNVIKYVSRAKHKGQRVEDLEKAMWYLNYSTKLSKKIEQKD